MQQQTEVTHRMRAMVVDWLVDVAAESNHDRETLFLSINYLDRFLSVTEVPKRHLQLTGAAAFFLAS